MNPMQYFEFVGWLITQFANLEFHLRRWLHIHSGMSVEAFQTIVGYPRTEDAISKLRKLLPGELPDEARAEIAAAFDQLGHISRLRNWIVHYGGNEVDEPGDHFLIRLNPRETAEQTGLAQIIIPRWDAWTACSDINTIESFLMGHLDDSIDHQTRETILRVARERLPWRYKPPRLRQSRATRP